MSVPLTIWVSSNTRARQIEGIFNIPPFVTAQPLGGEREGAGVQESLKTANALQKFLESEVRNPLALDGYNAGEKIITEKTNYGTSALKVFIEADKVLLVPPGDAVDIIRGRPKWAYVSFEDLIYWDGYGTDTQAMPYVGHEFPRTWAEMLTWVEMGYYEKSAVNAVKAFYDDNKPGRDSSSPVTVIEHPIAELYLNFPTTVRQNEDGSTTIGLPAALIVDYHMKAQKILRVTWNTNPRGVRPIFVDQFDVNPDPRLLQGQGVCEKLEGAQDETDAVHNIGIEAGKLAAAHLIGVKMGSQAEKDLGGGDPIMPGDLYASEDPDDDVTTKPLGDPNAAVVAVQLEEHTRQYVMRMFGFDEGSLGDTTAGKRVPASLGLSIQREGKIPTSHSLSKSSNMYTDAMYLTIDLYRQVLPMDSLIAAVGQEAAQNLLTTVFAVADVEARNQFVINVTAQDASTINEQRKNELMMMTQFLFGFYDKLVQMGMLAAQVPPEFQPILTDIVEKIQNAVRLLLSNIESIQNPEDVIPEVAAAIRELGQLSQSIAGGSPGGAPVQSGAA
ncbi:MAG: hypothetical protein E4H20_04670 [Spirochaetales bacterium]|nr:MAG: hypothetical protein E4H20_04670 [Spirochaetales bacterium]